jgi:hypothetical protein
VKYLRFEQVSLRRKKLKFFNLENRIKNSDMKRLVLNMVYGATHEANSGKALVTGKTRTYILSLFLRDVGRYYWNKKQVLSEYEMNEGKCVENGYLKMFRFFDTYRLFFIGCREGHLEVVKYLVERRVDVHTTNDLALTRACQYGRLEVVKYLVEKGVDIHADNQWFLQSACEYGHLEVVKYLVEKGADVHAQNDWFLQSACEYGHLEVVKYLIEHGADVHAENDHALRLASGNGHFEVVKYLVEKGANVRAVDIQSSEWASGEAYSQIARFLACYKIEKI